MFFVGRRIVGELRNAVRATRAPRKRDAASGVTFSVLMGLHYAVFFIVDARHLLLQYRRWSAASANVRVLDKGATPPSSPVATSEDVV